MAAAADTSARTVLCIAGGPRRHGNSERLLDELVAGVREAGGIAQVVVVAESHVAACRGCNACSITGECVVRDGMDAIYPLLDAADAIAISSPVYFSTVPAVLKALYDRCQPYWARRYVLKEPRRPYKRPGAYLLVGGGGDPYGSECAVTATKSVFAVLDVELPAQRTLRVIGPDSPSDIGRHPDALARAREIGWELATGVDSAPSL